ncbi:P-selectin-like [Carassius auratus]|uniref:E-selectin n=1 Tax=Carassius auratus TaxID=7957 RepID=A0A6P6MXQ2_CARAU|nr:P-selectin-like [Carassius auratus]
MKLVVTITMVLLAHIRLFVYLVLVTGIYNVKAWTYHYNITINMDWTTARQWCQKHYTDMVAIQNHAEVEYLNQVLPFNKGYYWIGIRKINGNWMWVGTKKNLDPEAENWAENEPNNKGSEQDCVEIYIKRTKETAKWNDERCSKKKATVCYLASCSKESCSEHAECVENIGSYECQCLPGFTGPRCEEAVQCLPIIDVPGGWMNCTHPLSIHSFNSSCDFKCEEGFELKGSNTTWCDQTGKWTHKPPTCQVVKCDPLKPVSHGSLQCSDPVEFAYGSSCWLKCDFGFAHNSTNSTHCTKEGKWSHIPPVCQAIQCPPLSDAPSYGSITCTHPLSTNSYNSSCEFKCEEGFLLKGANSTHCDHTGHWTHSTPSCTAVACDPLVTPAKSHLTCADPLGMFSFRSSCITTWSAPTPVCQVIRCDALESGQHGSLHCQDHLGKFSYGTLCWLECGAGFTLNGSNSTSCTSQGKWSHEFPVCQVVTCNAILAPANGHLTCADPLGKFSFRSSCNVSCDEGYKIRGKATLTCLSDGIWSAPTPACEVVKCDPLKPVSHGSLQCSDPVEFAYGSSCWLKCDFGFAHNSTNSTHCTKEGKWSHIPPVCQAIQCPPLSDAPSYGSITCTHPLSTNSYNSSCEFKCEEGFLLKGANSTHCDHTGHWTHSTPSCTAVACAPLVTPAKSHLTCADPLGMFSFRSSCITTCEEGYTLRGETTLTCLSDGSWSAPTPVCQVIRCDALESGQHGSLHCQDHMGKFSYGTLCWLECGAGFTLNGSNSTSCTSQGKWSHEFPVCQARQCNPLIKPSHGTVTCTHPNGQFSFGTVCNVSCQEGFKLHGTPQIECSEMGKWTDTPAFCSAQQCPHLAAPVNGWLNCSHPHFSFSYGSRCFLGCETGFEITGVPVMECSASGNWSQEMPYCAAVRCDPLSLSHLPELGTPPSMNCSHPHGNFSFGSQCTFQCAESQKLSGTSQLSCTSSGYWTNSPPSCVVKEMSVGAGMLMYAAVGAASSAGLLLFGGLMFLLMRQLFKKSKKLIDPVPPLEQPFLY